ncbi:MAG: hypothetical protein AB8B50_13770 [Pirellulaceae bacterium]
MRIDSGSNPIKPNIVPRDNVSSRSGAGVPSTASLIGANVDVGQIDGLLQLIVSGNEISENLVNQVRAKIQTEEYASKASAYEAADAILNL